VPVDFLTDEQALRYGRYSGEPTAAQLARYFYLDDSDRSYISIRPGDHNRLGFAVQLCTVRFIGTFLSDPTDVPAGVVKHLAAQLAISDDSCLVRYLERPATHRERAGDIQGRGEYRDFSEQPDHFRLVRWLYTRSWLSAERPSVLFDLATARLVENKILLPGVTVLTRLIARVRDRASVRLWRLLAGLPSRERRDWLEQLLIVPEQDHVSPLDRLRHAPTRISAPAMVDALERLNNIRSFGVSPIEMARLPVGRVRALARYAAAAWAATIERMPFDRRIATLVAFAHTFEAAAQDDALDLLNQLIIQNLARAERQGKRERLRTIHDLDAAAIQLKDVGKLVHSPACEDIKLRATIYTQIGREQVERAVAAIEALTRPEDDNYYEFLLNNYPTIRRFLPSLLRSIPFEGVKAAQRHSGQLSS
jgi:hypothetical protein